MAESSNKVAFDGPRRNTFLLSPESPSIVIVGLDTRDEDSHPLYDSRIHKPLREATVLDIMANGVIEPIIVCKGRRCAPLADGSAVPPDAAIVTDGRRRVMHAREANRRLMASGAVPIRVPVLSPMRGTDSELLGRVVALNEHREEDSALGKARKIERLRSMGQTDIEIGALFGVSSQTVVKIASLLALSPAVVAKLEAHDITLTRAYALAGLDADEQDEALESEPTKRTTTNRDGKETAARRPTVKALRKLLEAGGWPKPFEIGLRYASGELSIEQANEVCESYGSN